MISTMKPQSIAAVTIVFHPPQDVVKNILSYIDSIGLLIVIDNSPKETVFLKELHEKILYIHDGENKGIAVRLNLAARMAAGQGYDFLMTFDEDSFFDKDMLDAYMHCFLQSEFLSTTAMYGIENDARLLTQGSCHEKNKEILITSGSIVNLEIFTKLGGFDEALFIDFVDTEYCLRAMKAGYGVRKFTNILLNHSIGVSSEHYSYKTFKKTKRSLHSPVRLYYMLRNFFYLRKKYKGSFEKEFGSVKKNLMVMIKNNMLYNQERRKVISYLAKAVNDYRKGRMGKIVE
jgi:rhamnosyltransferase